MTVSPGRARSLRDRGAIGRRGHGGGVPGAGRAAGARGRDQGASGRLADDRAASALRAGGARGVRPESSQHRHDLRHREADGALYIAMELVEGQTLRESLASGAPLPTKRLLESPSRSPTAWRGRTRGHRPPGPEAREPDGHQGRARQDPRLRPGEADRDRPRRRTVGAADAVAPRPSRARSWARSGTCRRSRRAGSRWTSGRTSSPSARSCTRWRRAGARSSARPRRDARGDHPRGARAARAGSPRGSRRPCAGSSSAASPRTRRSATPRREDLARDLASVPDQLRRHQARATSPPRNRRVAERSAGSARSRCSPRAWRSVWWPERSCRRSPTPPFASLASLSTAERSLPPGSRRTARRSSTERPGTAARCGIYSTRSDGQDRDRSTCRRPTFSPSRPRARWRFHSGSTSRSDSRQAARSRASPSAEGLRGRSSKTSWTPTGRPMAKIWPSPASPTAGSVSSIPSARFSTRAPPGSPTSGSRPTAA